MGYLMLIHVDGACRNNGTTFAIGAGAAVWISSRPPYSSATRVLDGSAIHTNQRAEILGVILGLELAIRRWNDTDRQPFMNVIIKSDSQYAINCMTTWLEKWLQNGWMNCEGRPVANRDLITQAKELHDVLTDLGRVRYVWIPREENEIADVECNVVLDKLEEEAEWRENMAAAPNVPVDIIPLPMDMMNAHTGPEPDFLE